MKNPNASLWVCPDSPTHMLTSILKVTKKHDYHPHKILHPFDMTLHIQFAKRVWVMQKEKKNIRVQRTNSQPERLMFNTMEGDEPIAR